ncbi:MAG: tetratricopeptide repeat protein [Nitrospirae bacterium]|nr:tetratricopeptide repeat protein [Nitrospirota bacterium]
MGKASRSKERSKNGASAGFASFSQPLPKFHYSWLIPLFLALLTNANVLLNGFAWDDAIFFVEYSDQKPNALGLAQDAYYRPLISWSYQLDHWIWGLKPFGFHLSVYLAHAITTLLLYLCVRLLLRLYRREESIALLTASLFAVHPIHAEAVAWISGRNDVYMTLFMMTALYAFLRYRQEPSSWIMLPLFALGSVLGLLSKETAIPFLMIFPVLDVLFHRSEVIRWRGMKDPLTWVWVLSLGLFILYRLVQVGMPPAYSDEVPLAGGIKTLFLALGYYLKLLFIPYPLNLFVAELPSGGVGVSYLLIGASGTIILLLGIFKWSRTLFAIGVVWFIAGMAAPLVVPFVPVSVTPVAERYAYLASGGFLFMITVGALEGRRWFQARWDRPIQAQWVIGGMVLIVSLFSYLTMERNAIWRDEAILWENTVLKLPHAALPHYNLGNVYKRRGRLEEAITEYQTAINLQPDYANAHHNLGVVYKDLGRLEDAIKEYQTALKLQPDFVAHHNLGVAFKDLGRLEDAVKEYQTALKLQPDFVEAHNNLGVVYKDLGRLEDAVKEYQTAVKLQPDYANAHYNLGLAFGRQERLEEALRELQAAIRLGPNHEDAHYNTALIYRKLGRLEEAVQEYQIAIRLKPEDAAVYNNLGFVYQVQGRFEEAIREYRAAIKLQPDSVEVHNRLGNILAQQGQLDEAIKEFQIALKLQPDYAPAHNNLGNASAKQGRLEEAIKEYQIAIKLQPDNDDPYNNLGEVYRVRGQLQEAIKAYQTALRLNPNNVNAHYNLGVVYQRLGKLEEAKKQYQQALQLKPDFLPARKALESVPK